MSIIPASRLTRDDLERLGHNVVGRKKPSPSAAVLRRRLVSAVNRSLAIVGEQVDSLHRMPAAVR